MSNEEKEPADRTPPAEYQHPVLDLIVPLVILASSLGYAWSLRRIADPELNLLFLRPVFVILWVLLGIVVVRDLWPRLRAHTGGGGYAPRPRLSIMPGSEGGAGLVVLATLIYAVAAMHSEAVFLASTCVYLIAASWLIGERSIVRMLAQGLFGTGGIYLVMFVILGLRFS